MLNVINVCAVFVHIYIYIIYLCVIYIYIYIYIYINKLFTSSQLVLDSRFSDKSHITIQVYQHSITNLLVFHSRVHLALCLLSIPNPKMCHINLLAFQFLISRFLLLF